MYNKKEDCMNNLTKIWNDLTTELVDKQHNEGYLDGLNKKFGEIFDIKDVTEYKAACMTEPFFSPAQFTHLSNAMRRALVEGYLLAQIERKKEDIKMLYNCYKEDVKNEEDNDSTGTDGTVPRCSISGNDNVLGLPESVPRLPKPVRRRKRVLPPTDNE